MKKSILLLVILLQAATYTLKAQQQTNKEFFPITPMVSEELSLNKGVIKSLENKARQMLTSNGFASKSNRILLTANIVEISKDVTPTAPPVFDINMEATFYIVDIIEKAIINEITFEVKGTDKMEHKAYIKAINKINPRSQEVRKFVAESKRLLSEYYNNRLPSIIKKAETLAAQELYDDAITSLCDIPETVNGYNEAADKMQVIYQQKIDHDANYLINEAKALMAARNYNDALGALMEVNPNSTRNKDAQLLVKNIRNSIAAEERARIEAELRKFELLQEEKNRQRDDNITLEKMRINAMREIGSIKIEENQPAIMNELGAWFKSAFK